MKRIIMLSTLAIALGVTVILVGTTATLAKPTPIGTTFTIRGTCDFPVLLEASGTLDVIELPDGNTFIHGPSTTITLTNLEEPDNQVTFATHTAETQTPLDNGETLVTFTGHILWSISKKSLELFIGQTTFLVKGNGHYELLSSEGQVIDMCAELA